MVLEVASPLLRKLLHDRLGDDSGVTGIRRGKRTSLPFALRVARRLVRIRSQIIVSELLALEGLGYMPKLFKPVQHASVVPVHKLRRMVLQMLETDMVLDAEEATL